MPHALWTSASPGHTRVLVGAPGGVPAVPDGWWVVRARCDGPPRMLGPILEAKVQVDRLIGDRTPVVELAADRVRSGLRRRLLGDEPAAGWPADGDLVAELNRLSDTVDGTPCIVFEAVDSADAATLAFLRRVVARPGWLKPVLVLGLRELPAIGPVAELVATVIEAEGDDAVLDERPTDSPTEAPRRPEGSMLAYLAPGDRMVLRAAAVVGSGFEATLVARLLDREPMDVLLALQAAHDAGWPVEDLGDGRFHLPPALAAQLSGELLPSLLSAWNRRLARLLSKGEEEEAPLPADKAAVRVPEEAPAVEEDAGPPPHEAEQQARAAHHSAQAGDVDEAVDRYLDSARQLAGQGAVDQALAYASEVTALLQRLPRTEERRRLAASAHALAGQLLWEGSGHGGAYTLDAAAKALDAALEEAGDSDDVALKAEIRRLVAAVAYDKGDDKSLDRALDELTEAIRELSRAGEARAAARLLNDQAAVYCAMGDPLRATHLLEQSLDTFSALAARAARDSRREGRMLTPEEQADRREVAETRHLMARLPLAVQAKPGKRGAALDKAQEHAQEAEEIYGALGMERELARVWQTRGRLARASGDHGRAREYLARAARVQLNLGDALGLARTTDAMADLLGDRGEHAEALRMLVDSVRLNHGKGSPRGLAWNRRSLTALAGQVDEGKRGELAPLIIAVRRQLEAAEGQLGRVELPEGLMG
ncbi:MAG: tetratricopeptide repeat protein [Alphaproteobacteria bacterium]|nr:tetratricopeptide repeat protein [Alphaproteobacteria bacterium]